MDRCGHHCLRYRGRAVSQHDRRARRRSQPCSRRCAGGLSRSRPGWRLMSKLIRFGRGVVIVLVAVFTMGSASTAVRYNELGHKMMCVCGCNQILIECNHLGCPDSDRMLGELRASIAGGSSDDAILTAFQEKYGATVLAAPMLTRFNIIAWIVPPGVLILGIAGTAVLV